jgi:hypothetical protein
MSTFDGFMRVHEQRANPETIAADTMRTLDTPEVRDLANQLEQSPAARRSAFSTLYTDLGGVAPTPGGSRLPWRPSDWVALKAAGEQWEDPSVQRFAKSFTRMFFTLPGAMLQRLNIARTNVVEHAREKLDALADDISNFRSDP